jgi:hypothetical protein
LLHNALRLQLRFEVGFWRESLRIARWRDGLESRPRHTVMRT